MSGAQLSFPRLQAKIGFKGDSEGRTLRSELERREKKHGVEFIRRERLGKLTRYRCTVADVRKYAPDLIHESEKQSGLLAEAKAALADIDARARAAALDEVEKWTPRIVVLEKNQNEASGILNRLAARVNEIDARVGPR